MKNKKTKKVFILHGWSYSIDKWQSFSDFLRKIGLEPVVLRIPGLTSTLEEVWNLEDYIQWLREILSKEKGEIILLGHSNGGRICLAYAIKYPEKISKLILIDSAGIYHKELVLRIKRSFFKSVAIIGKSLGLSDIFRTLLYKIIREHDYEKANEITRQTMRNLIEVDLSDKLEYVNVPVDIIWGREDKITPLKDGRIMHEKIKNSKLFIIDNARHSPQFTHLKEVGGFIREDIGE